MRKRIATTAAAIAMLVAVAPTATADVPSCAGGDHPGGDWPTLNGDLSNARHQGAERVIGVDNVAALELAWTFSVREHSPAGVGSLQSTPVIADGCVYVGTSTGYYGQSAGDVFALNADTGELVWHAQVPGDVVGLAVVDGLVFAVPSSATDVGTRAIALDAGSGTVVWESELLDTGFDHDGSITQASPVVYQVGRRRVVFVPLSIGWGDGARVPWYFLDARTGRTIKRALALTNAEYEHGYGGVGIWSTAAVDAATGHLYAGTADSEGHRKQHRYNNALVKIDGDPRRATFGSVVDAYSGTTERYDLDHRFVGYQNNPLCEQAARDPRGRMPGLDNSGATECGELDLDIGASPNLFVNSEGNIMVAASQKSGVLHVVHADNMQPAWTKVVSHPSAAGNGATGAVDPQRLYTAANHSAVVALDPLLGSPHWVTSSGLDEFAWQPVTLANGVLYKLSNIGALVAWEAATGRPLLHLPPPTTIALHCIGAGAGVAIARNTVYAPCDGGFGGLPPAVPGGLAAYRVPTAPSDVEPGTDRAGPL